jgi:hypothetical protein
LEEFSIQILNIVVKELCSIWTFRPEYGSFPVDMNASLVKSAPQGDFVEISALMKSWEINIQTLVSQKRPIKFDMYPKQNIPPEIRNLLGQTGYHDHILENDRWQHFLVPASNETVSDHS